MIKIKSPEIFNVSQETDIFSFSPKANQEN